MQRASDTTRFGKILLTLLIVVTSLVSMLAQEKADKTQVVAKLIEGKRFSFLVQSVSPARGGMLQQTPGYKVVVHADTVTADLPYFGRGYQANFDSSNAGINFTSTEFDYKSEARKKGGWNITIKPKGEKSVKQMTLSVTATGRATMFVTCNDRESINYDGFIE